MLKPLQRLVNISGAPLKVDVSFKFWGLRQVPQGGVGQDMGATPMLGRNATHGDGQQSPTCALFVKTIRAVFHGPEHRQSLGVREGIARPRLQVSIGSRSLATAYNPAFHTLSILNSVNA